MTSLNSVSGAGSVQLESLESLKASSSRVEPDQTTISPLESLDSLKAGSYTAQNNAIPANGDILPPIDALNPEIPQEESSGGESKGWGRAIGLVKGIGLAAGDSASGLLTLGKGLAGAVIHPGRAIKATGSFLGYAVTHPADLVIGMAKAVATPYQEAWKDGRKAEAIGRGIFDVGTIILTTGLAKEAKSIAAGGDAVVVAGETGAEIEKVSRHASKARRVIEAAEVAETGAGIVAKSEVNGGIKLAQNAINNVVKATGKSKVVIQGDIIINVGGNTLKNVSTAGKGAVQAGEVLGGIERVASTAAKTESLVGAGSKISLGLGEVGGTLKQGLGAIVDLIKPPGGFGNGLANVVGEGAAGTIKNITGKVGTTFRVGTQLVKAKPISSAIVVGKAVHIVDSGAKATDHYNPK